VCFVKRAYAAPPAHVYHDAKTITVQGNVFKYTKSFPEGVVGQAYSCKQEEGRFVLADESNVPVDLLKMLDARDASVLHADMAALINAHKWDPYYAASIVGQFQEEFLQKGIRLSLVEHKMEKLDELSFEGVQIPVMECLFWFKYIDIAASWIEAKAGIASLGANAKRY